MQKAIHTGHHVLDCAHAAKQIDDLIGSGDAGMVDLPALSACNVLTIQQDFAVIQLIDTGDAVEKRRFTCAVRTDQSVDLVRVDT